MEIRIMKIYSKVVIYLFLIRCLDLISTHFAVIDLQQQEMHFIVSVYGLGFQELVFFEIFFLVFILLLFYWALNQQKLGKSTSFYNFLMKMSLKQFFVFLGLLAPRFFILIGIFAILNNIWVILCHKGINSAKQLYDFFEAYNFFEFSYHIMFWVVLFFLSYFFFKKEFYIDDKELHL